MSEVLSFAGWRPGNPDQIIPLNGKNCVDAALSRMNNCNN